MNLYEKIIAAKKPFLIAGPCVIEAPEIMQEIVETLQRATAQRDMLFIFKASYQKANRTSASSPSGPGLQKGLQILKQIKAKYQVPIITDIHECCEAQPVAEVADIIQIPSFLSRQTALIQAAAATGKIVNIKKGQFMAPEDIAAAAEKSAISGNEKILLTERGSSFGYHNLVVDFRGFAIMQQSGYPVVYDVTHSLQQPSQGKTSGGTPQYVPLMARAAAATGAVKGFFIETHPQPALGLSDAKTMFELQKIPQLLDELIEIFHLVKK
ncbi:MAG: 3-deoxy-8-phosphooctulonate synthase [Candidatus Cloacimonadales bacterium]